MADTSLVIQWDPDMERKLLRYAGTGAAVEAAALTIGGRAKQLAGAAENRRAGAYMRSLHVRNGNDSISRWSAVVAERHAIVLEYGWSHYRTKKRYAGKKILTRALRDSRTVQ